jgi:hypothetical protein
VLRRQFVTSGANVETTILLVGSNREAARPNDRNSMCINEKQRSTIDGEELFCF